MFRNWPCLHPPVLERDLNHTSTPNITTFRTKFVRDRLPEVSTSLIHFRSESTAKRLMTFQQCIVRTPAKEIKLGHLVKSRGNHQSDAAIRRNLNVSEIRHCIHIYRKAIRLHEVTGSVMDYRGGFRETNSPSNCEKCWGDKKSYYALSVNLLVVDVVCKWSIFFRIPNVARTLRRFLSRSPFSSRLSITSFTQET